LPVCFVGNFDVDLVSVAILTCYAHEKKKKNPGTHFAVHHTGSDYRPGILRNRSIKLEEFSMRKNMSAGKRESGFTLTEVLVTFAIIAILSAIAVPGFSRWMPNYRLKSAARDVVSNFQSAKLTAIKKGINCTITFNQDIGGTVYDYVVYEDANNNLEYDTVPPPGHDEKVVTKVIFSDHYKGVSFDTTKGGGDGLTFAGNDNFPPLPSVAFRLNGLTRNNAGGSGAGTVFLRHTQNKTVSIDVFAAGTIRIN